MCVCFAFIPQWLIRDVADQSVAVELCNQLSNPRVLVVLCNRGKIMGTRATFSLPCGVRLSLRPGVGCHRLGFGCRLCVGICAQALRTCFQEIGQRHLIQHRDGFINLTMQQNDIQPDTPLICMSPSQGYAQIRRVPTNVHPCIASCAGVASTIPTASTSSKTVTQSCDGMQCLGTASTS